MPAQIVNASGRHPQPNGGRPAVHTAQRPSNSGALSPRTEVAWILVEMSMGAFEQDRTQRAMARPEPNQGQPTTPSTAVEAAHDEAAAEEAMTPGDSTEDELEVSQQHAPQQGQGQEHEQQEPRGFERLGEEDSHIDGSDSSVLATSGGRRPLPSSKPQLKRKRKGDGVKKEADEEDEKGAEAKKSPKKKKRTLKDGKGRNWKCSCGHSFARKDHLTRHTEDRHGLTTASGVKGFKTFPCDLCRASISRKDNFRAHIKSAHPDVRPEPEPRCVLVDEDGKLLDEDGNLLDEDGNILDEAPATSFMRNRARMARPDQAETTSGSSGPTGPRLGGFKAINK